MSFLVTIARGTETILQSTRPEPASNRTSRLFERHFRCKGRKHPSPGITKSSLFAAGLDSMTEPTRGAHHSHRMPLRHASRIRHPLARIEPHDTSLKLRNAGCRRRHGPLRGLRCTEYPARHMRYLTAIRRARGCPILSW